MTTLRNERSAIGGGSFGGRGVLSVERLTALLRHSGSTTDPVIRQRFAELVCGLKTASWTRRRFAAAGSVGAEGCLLKLALCRDLANLAGIVGSVLGPAVIADTGEWGTYAWANLLLGMPGYRIGGGTDEVMRSVSGERVLGLPKEP